MARDLSLGELRRQCENLRRLGLADVMNRIPGARQLIPGAEDPEVAVRRVCGMIDAMTAEERRDPGLLDPSRRRRIAAGSGVNPDEVEEFLGQFARVQLVLRDLAEMSLWERIKLVVLGWGRFRRPG
jgi:signal recognition particle subunit SRP54